MSNEPEAEVKRYYLVDGDRLRYDHLDAALNIAAMQKTHVEEVQVIARFSPITRASTDEFEVVYKAGWCDTHEEFGRPMEEHGCRWADPTEGDVCEWVPVYIRRPERPTDGSAK